jgi:hypothetical protein
MASQQLYLRLASRVDALDSLAATQLTGLERFKPAHNGGYLVQQ